jgi:hypothetical protein
MVGTVGRNIFPLKDPHVSAYKVIVAVAVGSCSSKITERGKSTKIGNAVQFHINALTDRSGARGEDVNSRTQTSADGDRVGVPRRYGCYPGYCIERKSMRCTKMLGEEFL